jgi:DNA polymerase-3 subunit epsilon
MSAAEPAILAFDTETTGLTLHPEADVRKQPRMIEFGGILLSARTGEILEEASIMIDPEEAITAEITKITGITNADVAGALTFAAALPQIRRIFAAAGHVCAHNLPFDKSIVHGELARAGAVEFPWPRGETCTVGLYRENWGRNPKLKELYLAVMGKPLDQTHRALDDVRAMVEIIQKERLWELMSVE